MRPIVASLFIISVVAALQADDASEVRKAFDDYKAAILEQKGAVAAEVVTSETLAEYQKYRDWALDASRETLSQFSFLNRFQVAIVRHRVPPDLLREMNGQRLFAYAVDHDWIGKNGVIRLSIGDVDVASGRATAVVHVSGKPTDVRFQFRKEGGSWKFDLVYLLELTNSALAQSVKAKGGSEDAVIFQFLESVSGRKVDDSIWDPKKAAQPGATDNPDDAQRVREDH